ncbi:MAG TPA: sulfotransferase [Gemmataceae bacterium]|nr:sulfotransferase [Gemmataceae bacterium]
MNAQFSTSRILEEARQHLRGGQLARAEEICRRVLAAQREQPEALNLMAVIAYQAGQLDVAISWLCRASQADPANPNHPNDLGIFHCHAGRLADAAACFEQAIRLQPGFPDAHNNLGYALYGLGRHQEARLSCEQALRLRPTFPEANNHLGLVYLEQGWPEQAEQQFHKALKARPQLLEVHRNLANAFVEQGRLEDAVAALEKALHMQPKFTEARINLADVLKKLGRFDQAVTHLRQVLRDNPDCAFAYWNLGNYAVQGKYRFSDAEVHHIHTLLEGNRQPLVERSLLHLTLADLLDHQGSYDAAFAHYRQGNALRKEWLHRVGRAFDPIEHRTLINRLMETFDKAFFEESWPAANNSEVPVFVIGMPRSGTTLVGQILSSHSSVLGAGELRDLGLMVSSNARPNEPFGDCVAHLAKESGPKLREISERYLSRLSKLGGSAQRVIDKMPDNFLLLGLIARMYPHARIIHCRRDPLDVCLSCYFQNFGGVVYSWSLEDLGLYYREYERLMAHWHHVLPLQVYDVRYEDLVARQEQVSRELVAFCGLKWEDRCLEFHKNPRPVKTASALQVRRPMYTSSLARWKHYSAHLEPLRRALGMPTTPAREYQRMPSLMPSSAVGES